MRNHVWYATVGLLLVTSLPAQAQEKPAFEVASVRRNSTDSDGVSLGIQPGGRFAAVNVPLSMLIRTAFRIRDFQLIGAPDWVSTERYDVIAKADGDLVPPSPGETISRLEWLLQSLLEDRFKLTVRRETRQLPIFALVLARADGKLGQDLKPTEGDCEPFRRRQDASTCGVRMTSGQLVGRNVPLSELTKMVSPTLERIVVDQTGLRGNYDFDLKWTPDRGQVPSIDPVGPSIFTALQEQLGLRLDSQRGPVEVFVIAHVERPSPD